MPYDAKVGSSQSTSEPALRVCCVFLAALSWPALALASSPDLLITQRGCDDYDRARLAELVAIEIQTIASEHPSRPSDVELSCTEHGVSILVVLRDGSAELSGEVDPRGTEPAARTRLLALRITELLAQLWAEKARPEPASPEAAPAADAGPAVKPHDERETAVYAGFAFRSLARPRAALFGAALGAEYQIGSSFALAFDVEAAQGSVQSEHARVGVSVGSAALHAAIGRRFGNWALGVGPGARIGWAKLSPEELAPNTAGSDVSGAWAGPLLLGRARWSKDWFALYFGVESGVFTLPLVGTLNGEAPEVELRGAWFAASLGLGARF